MFNWPFVFCVTAKRPPDSGGLLRNSLTLKCTVLTIFSVLKNILATVYHQSPLGPSNSPVGGYILLPPRRSQNPSCVTEFADKVCKCLNSGDDIMSYCSLQCCSGPCTGPTSDDLQFYNFTAAVKGQLISDG